MVSSHSSGDDNSAILCILWEFPLASALGLGSGLRLGFVLESGHLSRKYSIEQHLLIKKPAWQPSWSTEVHFLSSNKT